MDLKQLTENNSEYNLSNMYRDTIQKAFIRFPKFGRDLKKYPNRVEAIANEIGISARQVYRMLDHFNLRHLL